MQVSKWGNSLAIRLPADLVGQLHLKDGDQIKVTVDVDTPGQTKFAIRRDPKVDQALAKIRKLRRPLPSGFQFKREDEHAGGGKSLSSKSRK